MFEEKSYVGMANCYFCNEPSTVLIDKRMRNTLTRNMGVIDMTPCSECKKLMELGVMLISIRDETTEEEMKGPIPNPHRTGCVCVVKDEAIPRMMEGKEAEFALKHRFMFITDSAWKVYGLPTEAVNNLGQMKTSSIPEEEGA